MPGAVGMPESFVALADASPPPPFDAPEELPPETPDELLAPPLLLPPLLVAVVVPPPDPLVEGEPLDPPPPLDWSDGTLPPVFDPWNPPPPDVGAALHAASSTAKARTGCLKTT
jgi:hypothetical protein